MKESVWKDGRQMLIKLRIYASLRRTNAAFCHKAAHPAPVCLAKRHTTAPGLAAHSFCLLCLQFAFSKASSQSTVVDRFRRRLEA
jgi:hypothetical protein